MIPVRKVLGPVGIYHYYSKRHDLDIYLIADIHKICAKCPNNDMTVWINDFIVENIHCNNNLLIDLFLETPYLIRNGTEKTPGLNAPLKSYIQKVVKALNSCFSLDDKCPIPNLRAHYLDFRHASNSRNSHLWFYYSHYADDEDPDEDDDVVLADVKETYDMIKNSPYDDLVDVMVDIYDIKGIMASQYDNVNAQLKKKILGYIERKLSELIPGGKRSILKNLKGFIKYFDNAPRVQLASYLKDYGELDTWVLDYYMFGRLFRDYPRGSCQNVIYYAGAYHINSTIILLEELGFELVANAESDNQCLYVENIDQPLFSLLRANK